MRKTVICLFVFVLSWRVTGERPIPCPWPQPDKWGIYHLRWETVDRFCVEKFSQWRVLAFDDRKQVDEFLETKPSGVDFVTVDGVPVREENSKK